MNMYTHPDFRRRGIGAALLARLIDAARDAGCERVSLHALPLGQSIYSKAGFSRGDSEMVLKLGGAAGMCDEELVRQFESCTLPFNRWTHRAHVKVAHLYLKNHPFDEALKRLRAGIQRYNQIRGRAKSPPDYSRRDTWRHRHGGPGRKYHTRDPGSACGSQDIARPAALLFPSDGQALESGHFAPAALSQYRPIAA